MNNTNTFRKYLVDGVATVRLPKVTRYVDSTGNELIPVKHGRWKRSKFYKNIIFCDECGEPFELSNGIEHWNYCPNCGAKMQGDNDFCSRGERREDGNNDRN